MLESVHIKNLALIDEAEITFEEGLNILTGETGAGKSILIGAVSLALGERVPRELLRDGEEALVELIFSVEEGTAEKLRALEIEPEEGMVILTRRTKGTRSVARINSETVTAARMKEAAELLIDIHGQHEHQSLLSERTHLRILDQYLKEEAAKKKAAYEKEYREYQRLREELSGASIDDESRKRELSLLTFEVKEIEEGHLKEGEDELLEKEYRRLSNGKRIAKAMGRVVSLLSEGDRSASETVGHAAAEIRTAADYDEALSSLREEITEIDSLLSDAAHEAARYLHDADFDEERFRETEERLTEINRLKEKYGATIPAVLRSLAKKEERIRSLEDLDAFRTETETALRKTEEALSRRAEELSALRKRGGEKLSEEIREALLGLHFLEVQFKTEVTESAEYRSDGKDNVRFLISLNPGEPLQPLSHVASGGELSRIMLALKTVFAGQDDIDTLIFDEIDAGISGRTAQAVSEKLHAIARFHQTICITHLPQIAAMADAHYLIEKKAEGNGTISTVRRLTEEESITELARLLGGVRVTDAVLNNAREMKKLAKAEVEKQR